MTASLLDVNVLIALLDRDHVGHGVCSQWFAQHAEDGWATCPITENGFVRVVSGPGYAGRIPAIAARDLLASAREVEGHRFWPCDVSLLDADLFDAARLHGTKQVSDAYLLGLAVAHGGRLATLDRSIAASAVRRATPDGLIVIA